MTASPDYDRIARALRHMEVHFRRQPPVEELAELVGLSPFHFHRLFRRWAGTTPKRFLQQMTLQDAKRRLAAADTVLDAAYGAGLSGPSRLHDLFVSVDAVTPGEFKLRGAGVTIRYGVRETVYGPALVGATDRGICHLTFSVDRPEEELRARWPGARLVPDAEIAGCIDDALAPTGPARLHLRGTNFQLKVWEALLTIPSGALFTYGGLAERIGRPGAARAVGSAVGANPIAVLIPCHRVIRGTGALGGYRWGANLKRSMLAREAPAGDPLDVHIDQLHNRCRDIDDRWISQ